MNPFLKYLPMLVLSLAFADEFIEERKEKPQFKSVKHKRSIKKMNRAKKRHGKK